MFVGLKRLGFNLTCLFQEVVAEGVYSDLAAVDVGIKIPSTSCVGIRFHRSNMDTDIIPDWTVSGNMALG